MPLILAIEPDRRQRTKLALIARNQLHADLVTTDSVEQAVAALDEIVPDLILTSALVPAREGSALADRLRELAAEGLHVPTMIIPALAAPGQRLRTPQRSGGAVVRGRIAPNPPSPPPAVGCDPVAFGMQVLARLERAGVERHAEPRVAASPRITNAAPPETVNGPPSRDVSVVDTSELEIASSVKSAGDGDNAYRADKALPDWSSVLSGMRRDIDRAHRAHEERMALAIPLSLAPSAPAFVDFAAVAPIEPPPAAVVPQATEAPGPEAATADATRKIRRRRTPPQDEWGFFDPQQCGVSALIAKVNKINTPGSPKKPA